MREASAPDQEAMGWTGALRRYLARRLPLENLLPERQPYYVGPGSTSLG